MRVGNGKHNYDWVEKWGQMPDTDSTREAWSHHGIVVCENGNVVSFHQGDRKLVVFNSSGELISSTVLDVENAHGMTLTNEGSNEFIWIADNISGKVLKVTLDGKIVLSLSKPEIDTYGNGGKYAPTDVAIFEENNGGNGEIVVADGYGSSLVNFYSRHGEFQHSIDGSSGEGGSFSTPHGIWIDNRKSVPELYIADRSNGQIQVYSLKGEFLRCFGRGPGADWLHSPSGFASFGKYLVVAELRGSRLTLLDLDDEPVAYLGENTGAFKFNEGWPNVPHETLVPGKFNSPHGVAADTDGNIFVAEWLIGGRINKLTRSDQLS